MLDLVEEGGEAVLVLIEIQRLVGALKGLAGFHQHKTIYHGGHFIEADFQNIQLVEEGETIENHRIYLVAWWRVCRLVGRMLLCG